jgi:head-tail adaptor
MVIAGDLRYPIIITKLTSTKNEYNEDVQSYNTHISCKAGVKYQSGQKTLDNKEIFTKQFLIFSMYYRAVDETMRILFDGNNYKITFLEKNKFANELRIFAEKINV